jgi:hypothetical protein
VSFPEECANVSRMGRPKLDNPKLSATMRLPPEFWARAEKLMPFIARRRAGTCTRTEVFREALSRGLFLLEREAAREKKANGP